MPVADNKSLLPSLFKTVSFLIVRQNFTNEMSGKFLQLPGKFLQFLSGKMLQLSGKVLLLSGKMLRINNFFHCQAKTYRSNGPQFINHLKRMMVTNIV